MNPCPCGKLYNCYSHRYCHQAYGLTSKPSEAPIMKRFTTISGIAVGDTVKITRTSIKNVASDTRKQTHYSPQVEVSSVETKTYTWEGKVTFANADKILVDKVCCFYEDSLRDSNYEIEVTKAPKTVTLTLTEDQANTLAAIFMKIGGHPVTTRRGYVDQMHKQLGKLGIDPHMSAYTGDMEDGRGLHFTYVAGLDIPRSTLDSAF